MSDQDDKISDARQHVADLLADLTEEKRSAIINAFEVFVNAMLAKEFGPHQ